MLASSFSSVLLPEPLRPTIPKNSPWWISKETPSSARSSRYSRVANGRTTRSFSESTRCLGMRKDLWRSSTWITGGVVSVDIGRHLSLPAVKICIVSAEHSAYGGIGHALRRQAGLLSAHHEVTLIERPEPSEALARMSFAGEDHLHSAAALEAIEAAYREGGGPDVLEGCDYRALGLA